MQNNISVIEMQIIFNFSNIRRALKKRIKELPLKMTQQRILRGITFYGAIEKSLILHATAKSDKWIIGQHQNYFTYLIFFKHKGHITV